MDGGHQKNKTRTLFTQCHLPGNQIIDNVKKYISPN